MYANRISNTFSLYLYNRLFTYDDQKRNEKEMTEFDAVLKTKHTFLVLVLPQAVFEKLHVFVNVVI